MPTKKLRTRQEVNAMATNLKESDTLLAALAGATEAAIGFVQETISSSGAKRFDDYYAPRLRKAVEDVRAALAANPVLRILCPKCSEPYLDAAGKIERGEMLAGGAESVQAAARRLLDKDAPDIYAGDVRLVAEAVLAAPVPDLDDLVTEILARPGMMDLQGRVSMKKFAGAVLAAQHQGRTP
jgi:hypothetical protein